VKLRRAAPDIRRSGPLGGATRYEYDSAGQQVKQIDALGQERILAYARDDSVLRIEYRNAVHPTPEVRFTWDEHYPRINAMTDGTGTIRLRIRTCWACKEARAPRTSAGRTGQPTLTDYMAFRVLEDIRNAGINYSEIRDPNRHYTPEDVAQLREILRNSGYTPPYTAPRGRSESSNGLMCVRPGAGSDPTELTYGRQTGRTIDEILAGPDVINPAIK
jgi:YD repeat-containing protein